MTTKGKAPVLGPLGFNLKKFLWKVTLALIIVGTLVFIASKIRSENEGAAEPTEKLPQ